ncbi:MAG: hypothetical protein EOO53_15990 [Gammaproteobacteria bacterium]|nr:MAG: hypothetical protein EOO53_15990 [Gammaproteobacteria bacterium]
MIKLLNLSVLMLLSTLAFAEPDISVDLQDVTASQVVHLVYNDLLPDRQFFLDPKIANDQSLVSFRFANKKDKFKNFFVEFLQSLGYTLSTKNDIDFIIPSVPSKPFSDAENPNIKLFSYKPRFRDASFLMQQLSPLFSGHFSSQHQIAELSQPSNVVGQPGSALDKISNNADTMIFAGSIREIEVLKNLLSQLDSDPGQVVVTGMLFEVQTGSRSASAINIVSSLLKDRFSISFGSSSPSDNYMSFRSGDFSAIASLLDTDNRFKVLSNPNVRVASGKNAIFTVGQDVPVLGSVTFNGNSQQPTQSVDYRSSGVIFDISPTIRDAIIEVSVSQEISSFVQTTSGVNNSPTLTKRKLQTAITMQNDEVIVIGGLKETKVSGSTSGTKFLSFLQSKSNEDTNSEIILFLKIHRV